MLTPINTPPSIRRFAVYDLEWAPGREAKLRSNVTVRRPEVRLAGIYDGKQYRYYRTIAEFLNSELTPANNGMWFYAHAGGLADMLFLYQTLLEKSYRDPLFVVEASFSGSSAIIVKVKKLRRINSGHRSKLRVQYQWTFIDSLWLFNTRLAEIAKWIGMKKGKVDFETEDWNKLVEYNKLDCVIIWKAVRAFEDALLSLGGELQMTLASCAMRLFKRRFLTRPIFTNANVNLASRQAYIGSRVEVIQTRAKDGYYYDINSSFPFAMTEPAPGNFLGLSASISDHESALYVADVEVEVPDTYLPPLPMRSEGSVFFPTGRWRSRFNETDVRLLESRGGKIRKVHEVMYFEPFDDLGQYAVTLYNLRKNGQTEFEKIVYKLLLNSLYGKFAENPLKQSMVVNPLNTDCPHKPRHPRKADNPREPTCMTMLYPGVWLVENEVEVAHEHVPISARITAIARKNLFEYMDSCDETYYCDTDGFATDKPDLPTSKELGGLKLEKTFEDAEFVSPKVYRIDDKVKAKGMSLLDRRQIPEGLSEEEEEKTANRMKLERWLKLRAREGIEIERMARLREMYRIGETQPYTRIIRKRFSQANRSKRVMLENGDSRPWSVRELEDPETKALSRNALDLDGEYGDE